MLELGIVAALSMGFFGVSVQLDLFEWFEQLIDPRRYRQVDEALLTLPVALLLLMAYSWRRHREAQAETAAAVSAEHDLARANEEYRSLFDYHPRAVFSLDPQRRYRRVNAAGERLTGYTEQELAPMLFPVLETEDRDRIVAAFELAMGRSPQRLEASVVGRNGQWRDLDITMVPIVVEGEPEGVYLMAHDVTEDKQVRRDLARAVIDAEQADEAKTLLVANVSHELRTPLTSVIAAVEMLSDGDLDDVQRRLVGMISRNGHDLLRLVDDLLDLTRMAVGQLTVEAVPFDLGEVLDRTVAHLSPQAARKGLALRVDRHDPLPRTVVGDPLRVGQVLTNLLNNAVKFTDRGEVGLSLRWQRLAGEWLETVFLIWDTGIGIVPADQDRLFGHFVQADPSTTRRHGGVGLGLAISRQLVQLTGGTMSVQSEPGVGSTFTVRLPFRLAPE